MTQIGLLQGRTYVCVFGRQVDIVLRCFDVGPHLVYASVYKVNANTQQPVYMYADRNGGWASERILGLLRLIPGA